MVSVDGPSVGGGAIPSPGARLILNGGTGAGARLIGVASSWVAPECAQNKRMEGAEKPQPLKRLVIAHDEVRMGSTCLRMHMRRRVNSLTR